MQVCVTFLHKTEKRHIRKTTLKVKLEIHGRRYLYKPPDVPKQPLRAEDGHTQLE